MAADVTQAQIDAVVEVADQVLEVGVVGLYLYGSAVVGGLRPHSDLDFLVVVKEPTTTAQRSKLVTRLRPISRRGRRPADEHLPAGLHADAGVDEELGESTISRVCHGGEYKTYVLFCKVKPCRS